MLPDIKKIRIIGLQLLIYFMSYRKTLPIYCGLLCLLIAACSPSSPSTITGQLETIEHTELFHTQVSTATPAPSASSTPEAIELSPTPHPSRTPEPTPEICPPLKDIPISNISKLVVNIYNPPKPGSDDAHQGVDFAILNPDTLITLTGAPIQAVLDGKVVTTISDRNPYGNAILIETQISDLSTDWITKLQLPGPIPTLPPHPALTCPDTGYFTNLLGENLSLYLLYAHMENPPEQNPGDLVNCGDQLGTIGATGNALNPHLHLEVRIGPSEIPFTSLVHYDTRAKPEEMEAYCVWRVSGLFQPVNPMQFFIP